jgi:hypothetical protein
MGKGWQEKIKGWKLSWCFFSLSVGSSLHLLLAGPKNNGVHDNQAVSSACNSQHKRVIYGTDPNPGEESIWMVVWIVA